MVAGPGQEEFQEVIETGLTENMDMDPSNPKKLWISNWIMRVWAGLYGFFGKFPKALLCTEEGVLRITHAVSPETEATGLNRQQEAVNETITADGNSKTSYITDPYKREYYADIKVSDTGGSSPTLDVDIIDYNEETEVWEIVGSFSQFTADGNERIGLANVIGDRLAAQWTTGPTSDTFGVKIAITGKR